MHTGLFGGKSSFMPLADARADGDQVIAPYSKEQVKDAPSVEADGELSPQEEEQLYRHYGREYDSAGRRRPQRRPGRRSAATRPAPRPMMR